MRPGLTFSIFLICQAILSQEPDGNLIPNASFEKEITFGEIRDKNNWNKCLRDDTPDYFRFCTKDLNSPVFREFKGGPPPVDGMAYVGIFCYRVNPVRGVKDVREFIQVKLREPLVRDSTYTLVLNIALDPESTHALRNLNVLFTEDMIRARNEKQVFGMFPQVRFNDRWFSDTGWVSLNYSYKARGFENYLIIGNVLNDKSTGKKRVNYRAAVEGKDKWNLHESEEAAYYYFDDLSLAMKKPVPGKEESAPEPEPGPPDIPEPDERITIDEVREDTVFVLRKIFFEFDRADLLPESTAELNRLLDFMKRHPDVSIQIEGHTDNVGSYEYNMTLSGERAKAVVNYLIQNGISEDRLSWVGFGYTRPAMSNRSDIQRAQNRRVAFRIIE